MTASSLDIVLPCYNPLEGWEERIIYEFRELCNALPEIQIRIVLVNDGSVLVSEESMALIKKSIHFFTSVSLPQNRGKGFALRQGVSISEADIIIYTDVDFPYTTKSFLAIWHELKDGQSNIAAGVLGKAYYLKVPAFRKFISKLLRLMIRIFLRTKISDTQRGLKGFDRKGKDIFLKTTIDRYLFDLEFIYLASKKKNNLTIKAVEVELKENVRFSHIRFNMLLRESWNFLGLFLRSLTGR